MENKIIEQNKLIFKTKEFLSKRKKILFMILLLLFASLFGFIFFDIYYETQNKKISEKYIKAGIYLTSGNKKDSKTAYKEVIASKNKFYSLLALNNIIENNLEEDKIEILKLFKTIENIKNEEEQLNLVKLKKSLYLIKISRKEEGDKLLKEIISSDSIWKETALEILK
mgnify:CR=1 FL=1